MINGIIRLLHFEFKHWLKISNIMLLFVFVAIVILGNNLRETNYATVPHPGENRDEYSFGWLGLSLIQEKYPIAWSGIPGYKSTSYELINVDNIFDDQGPHDVLFPINKPWFDHPPLFGILVGGYAYMKGVREFVEASVGYLRLPMLKIALINTFLIFLLAKQLFGRHVGIISALLYSVIPTVVISSRLAVAENGYVSLFLLSIIFSVYYAKHKDIRYWHLACLSASIGVLMKISALSIPIYLFLTAIYLKDKNLKLLLATSILSAIFPLMLFALYGAYYDWTTFVAVLMSNSNRVYGAVSEVIYTAFKQAVVTKSFNDGWIQFGWVSLLILSFTKWRKNLGGSLITIASFSYFFVFVLFGSEGYGHYRIPFYPFLIISSAWLISKLYKNGNVFVFTFLILLPFGTAFHKIIGYEGFQNYILEMRIFILLVMITFISNLTAKSKRSFIYKFMFSMMLVITIYFSVSVIRYFNIDTWFFAT